VTGPTTATQPPSYRRVEEPLPGERELASAIHALWKHSRPEDVRALLARHPELASDPEVVLELAYEEFCRRLEAGEAPDPNAFAARFSACRSALQRLLETRAWLDNNPQWHYSPALCSWPVPGEVFLGYELVRELGRGAFSRVFLARQRAVGSRWVAVKVSVLGGTEADTLGRLAHPNIVPVHAAAVDEQTGLAAVCMPYLGCATLADLCDRAAAGPALPVKAASILETARAAADRVAGPAAGEPPDPELRRGDYVRGVLHLAAQLADALAFLHARNVCHRDLKPSNVLLTPAGRPMLLDFNLSSDPLAGKALLGGTFTYMPPEQLRATAPDADPVAEVGHRADLYALGVLLYELLAGKHPFGPPTGEHGAEGLRAALLARQRQGPVPLRAANAAVGQEVARLVERCLAFDPEDRPASGAEVARALRRARSRWRRAARQLRYGLRGALFAAAAGAASAGLVSDRTPDAPPLTGAAAPGEHDIEQHLGRGVSAFHDRDYQAAAEHLTRALGADPDHYAARILRARAYLRLDQVGRALADFEKADALVADGRTQAYRAYCLNRSDPPRHGEAVTHYERAIEAGFATPEVYNNLGYSRFQAGKDPRSLNAARSDLTTAIQGNRHLRAAYFNRALVDLETAFAHTDRVPRVGLADIDWAIKLGEPVTSDLWRLAADLNGMAAERTTGSKRQRYEDQALDAAERAIQLGQDPRAFDGDLCLQTLQTDRRLRNLVRRPRQVLPPGRTPRCVDPCPDLQD
jgi:serine/threonine protein kinase/Tfp pilus assembly protein PilF